MEQQRRHHNLNIRQFKDLLNMKYIFCMNFCNRCENLRNKDSCFIVINCLKGDACLQDIVCVFCIKEHWQSVKLMSSVSREISHLRFNRLINIYICLIMPNS